MKKIIVLMLLALVLVGCDSQYSTEATIDSPNQDVRVVIDAENALQYRVYYQEQLVIGSSQLGMMLKDDVSLINFTIKDIETSSFNESWSPVWGQKSLIENHYNALKLVLEEKNHHMVMNMYFRIYDDGIGFRYEIPEQEGVSTIEVMNELTAFKFESNPTTWWIKNDWNSYEYLYKETLLSDLNVASTPVTMKFDNGVHVSVHEAALVDYAGMALKLTDDLTLESHLAPWPDGSKVKLENYLLSPWRTVTLGHSAGDLAESDLILNLNEPTKYEDTSWIQPMKYMGIWWEMHIKKSDWGRHNNNHGATTENAKYYIDFIDQHLSSENQTIGLLVEGWNQGWDGNWIENYDLFEFTEDGEYEDFDVSEVVEYGNDRHVAYIMHNETSGGIENYEQAMEDAYDDYKRLGIHAIKSGYVADGGMKQPRGQHHHGQYMVNHYNRAVEKAAAYEIMINTHEPIKATGLSRTYPNWIAREGVQGMEYNAWSEGNPPEHTTILPFTRILGGPIDYTPGIFDVEVGGAVHRVHTTRAKQLALYVVLYSPLQMITDLPENYLDTDGEPYPEFKFVKDVAVDWDESHVLNGEIGDYVTIARKTKGKDEWFIGSITDEEHRELTIDFDFLDDQIYTAEVYTDALETHYLSSPNKVSVYKVLVKAEDQLRLSLAAGGGTAMRLVPATDLDKETIPYYKTSPLVVETVAITNELGSNDAFEAVLKIRNEGTVTMGYEVPFKINSELIETRYVRVPPMSEEEIIIGYDAFYEPGIYNITVADFIDEEVLVREKPATFELKDFETFINGDKLMSRLKVVNTGYHSGDIKLKLIINGQFIEERTLSIESAPGGKTKGVTFRYDLPSSGTYTVEINGLSLEIEYESE